MDRSGFEEEEELERAMFLPPGFPYHELMALAPVLEAAGVFKVCNGSRAPIRRHWKQRLTDLAISVTAAWRVAAASARGTQRPLWPKCSHPLAAEAARWSHVQLECGLSMARC